MDTRFVMRLYVAGGTAISLRAISNIKYVCENHLHGRCDLEVIDIYQQPDLAKENHILATPTLVKCAPHPSGRLVGQGLADIQNILVGLGLT